MSFRLGIIALVLITIIFELWNRRRLRLLAAGRPSEDIGTFARAFDRRDPLFDPWVVRAIWDELQAYVHVRGATPALRPADRLDDVVKIDPEDVWDVVLPEAAQRARRSLEQIKSNPMYGKVETVGDLVRLLALQPKQ